MTDIFVSYSRKDRDIVEKLVDVIRGQGWAVWWDPTIRPGEYFEDVIESALTDSKCVIVVWSKNSVASKWVRAEAAEAANRGVLVPVVIDDAKIPFRFKQIQEAHLSDWQFTSNHPELIKLLESINELITQAQKSQSSQPVINPGATDPRLLSQPEPPSFAQQNEPAALEIPTNKFQSENAQPRRPFPIKPQTADDSATVAQTRPEFALKRSIVITILLVIGITAGGGVYLIAFRKFAKMNNANQIETTQQNSASNEQANVSKTPLPHDTTPSVISPAPSSPLTDSPAASQAQVKKFEGLLKGRWQSQNAATNDCQCDSSPCLDIQFNKTISDFCVESNQVSVSAYYKLDAANNKAFLFFKEPADLGAGGVRMAWNKFDRKKPLATIDLSDLEAQHVIYVTWHGFTELGVSKQIGRHIGGGYQGTYLKR